MFAWVLIMGSAAGRHSYRDVISKAGIKSGKTAQTVGMTTLTCSEASAADDLERNYWPMHAL
jgi:hypothetical protein